MKLFIFTLDIVTRHYPVITVVDGLPYDCLSILPCPAATGGVMVLAANALIHVDQAARKLGLPVNGWPALTTDLTMPPVPAERNLRLEGAHVVFVSTRALFLFLADGTVHPVELAAGGNAVARLELRDALARTTAPSVVLRADADHVFVGSTAGPSVLMRTHSVEEPVADDDVEMAPAAVVDQPADSMDFDDDGAPSAHPSVPLASKTPL
jgi:cleavage and polyadenylation specificity factor subunit 1